MHKTITGRTEEEEEEGKDGGAKKGNKRKLIVIRARCCRICGWESDVRKKKLFFVSKTKMPVVSSPRKASSCFFSYRRRGVGTSVAALSHKKC